MVSWRDERIEERTWAKTKCSNEKLGSIKNIMNNLLNLTYTTGTYLQHAHCDRLIGNGAELGLYGIWHIEHVNLGLPSSELKEKIRNNTK
jgi:hypothetical protein